jgi:hypothetical protein
MFSAVAVANEKQTAINIGVITGNRRPYTSLNGAQSRGPMPKPKRYRLVPSVATGVDTWNSCATSCVPEAYEDEAQVADIVMRPYMSVVKTFFFVDQLIGR